ncbi:MAG: hypothetical protein PHW19_00005 [Salinivirgaceae bacterium]|nr:hypothetical protein [Salinivirgaceae bacterium]
MLRGLWIHKLLYGIIALRKEYKRALTKNHRNIDLKNVVHPTTWVIMEKNLQITKQ